MLPDRFRESRHHESLSDRGGRMKSLVMRNLAACIVLLSSVTVLSQVSGPKPPELSILTQRAQLIVDVTVESVTPYPSMPRQDVVLHVNSVMKGTPPPGDRFLLNHLSGGAGPGTIPMQVGERYVLFLRPVAANELGAPPVSVLAGLPRYGSISRDNAVKIDGNKIVVNPAMPFHGSHDGKSRDEFLQELRTLIGPK